MRREDLEERLDTEVTVTRFLMEVSTQEYLDSAEQIM